MNLGNINLFTILNLRKNKFLAIFFLFSYLPAQADVLIRASSAPFNQYAAWIATHSTDHTWVAELEKQHPSVHSSTQLLELAESAQKAFLTGSLIDAKKKFIAMSDLSHTEDWHKPQREAITYAMLRVAQLETNHQRSLFLKKAAQFGFDIHFAPEVFPPPLMKEWGHELMIAKKSSMKISKLKDFEGFDILKIDGRPYPIHDSESLMMTPGVHRVSLLANHAQYFSQKINGSQLQVMKIKPDILIAGSCEHPVVPNDIHFAFSAIFESTCIRHFNGLAWDSDFHIKLDKLDLQNDNFHNSPVNLSRSESPNLHSRQWLWLGASAVVLTSLILVYKNNQAQFGGGNTDSAPAVIPSHHEN